MAASMPLNNGFPFGGINHDTKANR